MMPKRVYSAARRTNNIRTIPLLPNTALTPREDHPAEWMNSGSRSNSRGGHANRKILFTDRQQVRNGMQFGS